jgi:hypothetical protein
MLKFEDTVIHGELGESIFNESNSAWIWPTGSLSGAPNGCVIIFGHYGAFIQGTNNGNLKALDIPSSQWIDSAFYENIAKLLDPAPSAAQVIASQNQAKIAPNEPIYGDLSGAINISAQSAPGGFTVSWSPGDPTITAYTFSLGTGSFKGDAKSGRFIGYKSIDGASIPNYPQTTYTFSNINKMITQSDGSSKAQYSPTDRFCFMIGYYSPTNPGGWGVRNILNINGGIGAPV